MNTEMRIDGQKARLRVEMMMHERAEITAERAMQSVKENSAPWLVTEVPASWWDELESCWRGGRCPTSGASFIRYCRNEPQCRTAIEAWATSRDDLGRLESTKFNLEVELAQLCRDMEVGGSEEVRSACEILQILTSGSGNR